MPAKYKSLILVKSVTEYLMEINSRWPLPRSMGNWVVFRGQMDSSLPLLPSIVRSPFNSDAVWRNVNEKRPAERQILIGFQHHCAAMFPDWVRDGTEKERSWKTLVVAQHFGLPTRLLDWSANPLVALFFALEQEPKNAVPGVFVLDQISNSTTIRGLSSSTKNPHAPIYRYSKLALFNPPHVDGRVIAQGSLFTLSKEPADPIFAHCIQFDPAYRTKALVELDSLGINRAVLFPDMDGAASYLKWSCRDWGDIITGVEPRVL